MHAIQVTPNTPPTLTWTAVPDLPPPTADHVLVDIKATAVNRADLSQARGLYPPPPGVTDILGLEMAGTIAAVGADVTAWQPGDRVCALLAGGGYAQQALIHQEMLLPIPDSFTYAQAAAIPEVWYTAYVNLFREGQLQAGEQLLIHAGASGVGTAAIQLAVHAGATVWTTAGAAAKLAACQALGAHGTINYKTDSFYDTIHAAGTGIDLILDPVGAAYLPDNLRLLNENGRLVHIGLLSGRHAEIDLRLVLGKSLRLIGSRLRSRPIAEKIDITNHFKREIWPRFHDGTFKPIIDTTFPLTNAQAAHDYIRQNRNTGKVILLAP